MKTILTTTAFALMASTALADTITLYTSQPNADAQQTVDAFKAANPDTDVEWVRDGTTKLMARHAGGHGPRRSADRLPIPRGCQL